MAKPEATTQAQAIFVDLERDILNGELLPHSHIDEALLIKRYDVSRTPAREALNLLAHAGLIRKIPRRGFQVAALDVGQVIQMFEVASNATGFAAKLAARRMSVSAKREARLILEESRRHLIAEDAEKYQHCAEAFHWELIYGSHNDYLIEYNEALSKRLTPYYRFKLYDLDRMKEDFSDHLKIMDAIDNGDAAFAFELMSHHATVGGDVLMEYAAMRRSAVSRETSDMP